MKRLALLLLPVLLSGAASAQSWQDDARAPGSDGRYRLSGKRELMPVALGDDGAKTYIQWAPDQALPAVFALDALGREEMVNGYMRGDIFTIDRVYDRLKFRIDKAELTARRLPPGTGR